jgi:serine kinase of HPr protein (carbohydrate metabolism regulator)
LGDKVTGWLVCSHDFKEGEVYYIGRQQSFVVNNALMMMYTFITSDKMTTLFHSSVVSYQGKAYMFLGKSGTGKSTHSQLWLKHIEGTELVNDDNPVVRIIDGEARVYGSPWSGKTPCYRNVDYPIGGIVKLKQAPRNEIRRMKPVEAYVAIAMSISGMRWNKKMADGLHETENLLTATIPIWHLSCLPDQEAAEICSQAIVNKE